MGALAFVVIVCLLFLMCLLLLLIFYISNRSKLIAGVVNNMTNEEKNRLNSNAHNLTKTSLMIKIIEEFNTQIILKEKFYKIQKKIKRVVSFILINFVVLTLVGITFTFLMN